MSDECRIKADAVVFDFVSVRRDEGSGLWVFYFYGFWDDGQAIEGLGYTEYGDGLAAQIRDLRCGQQRQQDQQ